ncbi:MAG: PAS domain-containing protein, partial [Armatimonadota bacterium]
MPFAVGAYELIIGCLMLTFPQVFGVGPRFPASRLFSYLDMSLVTGGIFTLMSVAVSGYRSGAIPTGFATVGILPLLISTFAAARVGAWMGVVVNATMVLGVLFDVVPRRARRTSARPGRSIPTLAVVMAIIAVVCGGLLLLAPEVLRVATYRTVRSHSLYFGGSMVAAAVALVVGWFLPRVRTATQVAAAFSVLVFAAGFVAARAWLAALAFGLLASVLAAEPVLSAWLKQRAAQRASQQRNVSDYEIATESVAWGFALLAALIASVDSDSQRGLGLAFLAFGTGMFTLAWFHLRSADAFGPSINVIASGAYSVLGVVFVQLTGGADSPYFFVYFLPIIALAWTQTPQAIVVPLTIPLSALLAEIAVDSLASGPGAVQGVFLAAIPRAVGLILTSGFTYLLARRNLESRVRARDARRQLEAVLAHMGEGLITTDQDGRVILCNPAAAEILGCKDRECEGQFLTELLPLSRADGIALGSREHPVRRALDGQRVSSERLAAERPQGALPVEVTATPFVGSNGAHGAIVLLRDAHADVDAERMRADFFFIASHELRTPLTVMKGNLEMALEAMPPPALQSPIEEAL